MAETKDLGPLFAHKYAYPTINAPIINWTLTQEIDPPFRTGRSVILRRPGRKNGLVIGVWCSRRVNEDDALLSALTGRIVTSAGNVTSDTLFGSDHALADEV